MAIIPVGRGIVDQPSEFFRTAVDISPTFTKEGFPKVLIKVNWFICSCCLWHIKNEQIVTVYSTKLLFNVNEEAELVFLP